MLASYFHHSVGNFPKNSHILVLFIIAYTDSLQLVTRLILVTSTMQSGGYASAGIQHRYNNNTGEVEESEEGGRGMENNKGKQQGELGAALGGSAASRVQLATPHPARRRARERLGGETRHTRAGKKRHQYLSSLLPLTVTRSFHVPGVVFTLPRSVEGWRWFL